MTTSTETSTETATSNPVGRPRLVSDAVLDKAKEMYESGSSPEKIARQVWCKVSPQTLRYHLNKADGAHAVEMRPRGRKGLSEDQAARCVELYAEGMTLTAIRKHADMKNGRAKFSLPTLSKALHEAGVEVRRGRPAKEAVEDVEAAPEAPPAAE